jgi:heat shock protein 1/8
MDHEVEGPPNDRLGKVILGIDVGDSFSRVAVWHNGSIELVPLDAEGNKEIPSCVAFQFSNGREEVLVGRPALEQLANGGAIHRVRRVLGQVDAADKSLVSGAHFWPFMVQSMGIQGERPVIAIKEGEDWVSIAPEEVVTLILRHLKGMAEKFLGHSVKEAILTGPAALTGCSAEYWQKLLEGRAYACAELCQSQA